MIGRLRQIAAALAALAMTAAPVLSCCAGIAVQAQAAEAGTGTAGQAGHEHHAGMAHHHRDDAGSPHHHAAAEDCENCAACTSAELTAEEAALPAGAGVQKEVAAVPVIADERADFIPALRRVFAPPHGPPIPHATPVTLKTTLRL
ncbi:MAG: hypothetical protein ACLFWF_15075 [Alphaproteobacteria bacterium]